MRLMAALALVLVSVPRIGWACFVDTECNTGSGDSTCGGSVCNYPSVTPGVCVAAGTSPGWCTADTRTHLINLEAI
jgi:hypothetical protein